MNALKTVTAIGWTKLIVYTIFLLGIYYSALIWLATNDWQRDGYTFGVFIPIIVLYLIWHKRNEWVSLPSMPSWKGFIPIILGLCFYWLGELSGVYFILYISFWLILVGLFWAHLGWEKLKTVGFALFFMLTMFPLPQFLNTKLLMKLRLISSKLGVTLIKIFGMPVHREGNIIDLGFTKLQVVEACSGLHSLISLLVLSLLLVYFFKEHLWKRAVVVVSSVPLAIFANSLRIAMTSVLYKHFGAEVAEGFFHGFSGLLIFILCIPVLLIEIKILEKLPPFRFKSEPTAFQSKNQMFNTVSNKKQNSQNQRRGQPVFIFAVIFLGLTVAFSQTVEFRETVPLRKPLEQFPLKFGGWSGESQQSMAQVFIDALDLSDYLMVDYNNPAGRAVNLYLAYYESQIKGESIHSPASCLPGTGWLFEESGTVNISFAPVNSGSLDVNRAVMQHGDDTRIAYYWFLQRGRTLTSAYQLKIYTFWDALTMHRTDGALVRLITPIYENERFADADARLQRFVRDIVPVLYAYIPGKDLGERK